jgi:hypothetical protein
MLCIAEGLLKRLSSNPIVTGALLLRPSAVVNCRKLFKHEYKRVYERYWQLRLRRRPLISTPISGSRSDQIAKVSCEYEEQNRAERAQSVLRRVTIWTAGIWFPGGVSNSLFSTASKSALGCTQPPLRCVPGVLSLLVKRLGCETDQTCT